MKYGRVLTYRDIEEAKKLIGKKVIYSDSYFYIQEKPNDCFVGHLDKIDNEAYSIDFSTVPYQFIREVIEEPQYKPYDLSNEETRKKLIGRKFKDTNDCLRIVHFVGKTDINNFSAEKFLDECQWIEPYDGSTVCGERVE